MQEEMFKSYYQVFARARKEETLKIMVKGAARKCGLEYITDAPYETQARRVRIVRWKTLLRAAALREEEIKRMKENSKHGELEEALRRALNGFKATRPQ